MLYEICQESLPPFAKTANENGEARGLLSNTPQGPEEMNRLIETYFCNLKCLFETLSPFSIDRRKS